MSSPVRASRGSRALRNCPTPGKGAGPSMKPWIASWPCRSMTCVRGPIHFAASASLPTAEIFSRRTASACTTGVAALRVTILPLRSTRSAGWPKAAPTRADKRRRRIRIRIALLDTQGAGRIESGGPASGDVRRERDGRGKDDRGDRDRGRVAGLNAEEHASDGGSKRYVSERAHGHSGDRERGDF